MTISRTDRTRLVSGGLGAGGLALLLFPRWSVRTLAPGRRAPAAWLVRVLRRPHRGAERPAAGPADPGGPAGRCGGRRPARGEHGAGGLVWPRYRQAAGVSAAFAAAATAAQLAVAPLADDPVHIPGDVD